MQSAPMFQSQIVVLFCTRVMGINAAIGLFNYDSQTRLERSRFGAGRLKQSAGAANS
jgi:hypothetical protein